MEFVINLKEKEIEFLKLFAGNQYEGSPENVGTCTPIHLVERADKTFVHDEDGETWVDVDDEFAEYSSLDALIEARKKKGELLPYFDEVDLEWVNEVFVTNDNEYVKAYNLNVYRGRNIISYHPVAFFFILEEAKRYRDGYQKHNCDDCRIYTYSLGYSNQGDMPVFRELLMHMGQMLIDNDKEMEGSV